MPPSDPTPDGDPPRVALGTIAREWARIGCIGFGGPPTHIALLRRRCVEQKGWIAASEFEDAIATANLLPGPASTQLAIYCAWRLRSAAGAVVGGICFIVPGLILILLLSAVFLADHPPTWVLGAADGADAVVPAVAIYAAWGLLPASWQRIGESARARFRWVAYALFGGAAAALVGPYLVLVLVGCGLCEVIVRSAARPRPPKPAAAMPLLVANVAAAGGLAALCWVAFKVGALSYGGGFVIIPLMQHDVVHVYHWMTAPQFLDAVALGQVTPGPVVQTVAVVGYAAAGLGGGLLAALVAFSPSFAFVLFGGPHFGQIRSNAAAQAFLTGAGPAVIGAIAGSAIPLGLSLQHLWQIPVTAAAMVGLLRSRNAVVPALLAAAGLGIVLALCGVPVRAHS
jgi:chromate transporter